MGMQLPLLEQMKAARLPAPEPEYEFHPERKWRFDFAWPARKLAVEIEGGLYATKLKDGKPGRHNRGKGMEEDMRKYNSASALGWTLLRFSTGMVKSGEALRQIAEVMR